MWATASCLTTAFAGASKPHGNADRATTRRDIALERQAALEPRAYRDGTGHYRVANCRPYNLKQGSLEPYSSFGVWISSATPVNWLRRAYEPHATTHCVS